MCQPIRELLFYMNYQRIHNEIIVRAKSENRKKIKNGVYYEQHHIIPRCMGGDNSKENLVLLTAREHFLVHWLLVRLYPENDKLTYAFRMLCNMTNKCSSIAYEESRENFSKSIRNRKHSEISKNKMRGKKKPKTKTHIENWKIANKNLNKDFSCKSVNCYYLNGEYYNTYNSLTEASKKHNLSISSISCCLNGKSKLSGNFIWKFKSTITNLNIEPYYKIKYNIKSEKIIKKPKIVFKKENKYVKNYNSKKVSKYSINNDYIESYLSITDACIKNNITYNKLLKCIKSLTNLLNGYIWKLEKI